MEIFFIGGNDKTNYTMQTFFILLVAHSTATVTTDKLNQGCAQLGIPLTEAQADCMRAHLQLLARWNRRLNLTAVTDPHEMTVRHLLDSLSIQPFVRGETVLDVGSGGGFPGLPLAVINPTVSVTVCDSRHRRAAFLRHACAALGLGNVTVADTRVQDVTVGAGKFDTLTVRAFASLAETLAATVSLHRPGVRLLAMKGKLPSAEIAALDGRLRARLHVEQLTVPFLSAARHLIIVDF